MARKPRQAGTLKRDEENESDKLNPETRPPVDEDPNSSFMAPLDGPPPEWMKADVGKGLEDLRPEHFAYLHDDESLSFDERLDPELTFRDYFDTLVLERLVEAIIDGHPVQGKNQDRRQRVRDAMHALTGKPKGKGKNQIEEDEILRKIVMYWNYRRLAKEHEAKFSVDKVVNEFLNQTHPYNDENCSSDKREKAFTRLKRKLSENRTEIAARVFVRQDWDL
jgi:hypothetical protein